MRAPIAEPEAEAALLGGALMRGVEAVATIQRGGLAREDFATPRFAAVWGAMTSLAERGAEVDPVSVASQLSKADEDRLVARDDAGVVAELALLDRYATPSALEAHAAIIRCAANQRRTRDWAACTAGELAAGGLDHGEWSAWVDTKAAEIANLAAIGREAGGTVSAEATLTAAFQDMVAEATGLSRGVGTGFEQLDRWLGGKGPRPGWLIVLCGRPKMGKTSFALSLTRAAMFSRVGGQPWGWQPRADPSPVLWACDEMRNSELAQRLMSDLCSLDGRAVMSPTRAWLTANMPKLQHARTLLDQSPLDFVDDRDCGRLERVFAAARTWRAKHRPGKDGKRPPAIVVVDYLQRMTMAGLPKGAKREERVSEMTKACKSLARELDVVVLLLAQLNRDLERRDNKRPVSSDLRESGAIEQEADVILGAFRPIVYNANAEEMRARYRELSHRAMTGCTQERIELRTRLRAAEIIILDSRHGPKGTAYVDFVGEHFRYEPRPLDAA